MGDKWLEWGDPSPWPEEGEGDGSREWNEFGESSASWGSDFVADEADMGDLARMRALNDEWFLAEEKERVVREAAAWKAEEELRLAAINEQALQARLDEVGRQHRRRVRQGFGLVGFAMNLLTQMARLDMAKEAKRSRPALTRSEQPKQLTGQAKNEEIIETTYTEELP